MNKSILLINCLLLALLLSCGNEATDQTTSGATEMPATEKPTERPAKSHDAKVDRIDKVVNFTAEQRAAATEIIKGFDGESMSREERRKVKDQIYAAINEKILTPEQQVLFQAYLASEKSKGKDE